MMRAREMLAAVAIAATTAGAAQGQTVGFATGPQATPTNAAGSAVAKVVNEASGLQTRAVPHTSNEVSLAPLNQGQVDFAIANGDIANAAFNGIDVFDGRKHANMRIVTRLFPLNLGVIVRKSSDIRKAADLKGKCYPAGFTAQKGQVKVATALLANAGLTYDDVKGSPVPNTSRGGEDFAQGKCDSAMMALGAARLKQIDAQVGGVRILPIDTAPEAVARMKKYVPYSNVYELKAGTVPGAEVTTPIMSYDIILVASTHTKDDVVYQTVKAMHAGKAKLAAVTPILRDFDPARMHTSYEGLPYHPGALKFYQEAGVALSK
jgi:TRAP transporter TAXI family solute receptor